MKIHQQAVSCQKNTFGIPKVLETFKFEAL